MTPAIVLMRQAQMACAAVAAGPFTPIVIERYEHIGGERGYRLGRPTQTQSGRGGICWTQHRGRK